MVDISIYVKLYFKKPYIKKKYYKIIQLSNPFLGRTEITNYVPFSISTQSGVVQSFYFITVITE